MSPIHMPESHDMGDGGVFDVEHRGDQFGELYLEPAGKNIRLKAAQLPPAN